MTLSAAVALAWVKEGLAAPIHIVDGGYSFNGSLDALAAMGKQLLSVQDTWAQSSYGPFPYAISVADVLALAPKMTDYHGNPETFSAVTDSAANVCLLYTSPSPRDRTRSRMPSSA